MNTQELIEQVKALPEIELQEFFEGLEDHIHKNNYGHIVESSFPSNDEDEMNELEATIEDKDREIDILEGELRGWRHRQTSAIELLDEFEFEGDPAAALEELIKGVKEAIS